MITPQRWQEIDRIFAAALEREPAGRSAFLDEACGGDELLRKEVESLLANDIPESLIANRAVEEATRLLEQSAGELTFDRIGRYRIIRSLGAGGMGHVYLGLDEQLNRQVAVKLLSHYGADEEEGMRRFRQEALAASALNHPNILTIYEIGEFEGTNFIIAEFVDGVTLRARIKADVLPLKLALDVAIQIASALSAAHAAGIVHRDIKPDNVMIRPDGVAKLLDFGIAKLTEQKIGLIDAEAATALKARTSPGMIIGTAGYMSPEQARGKAVDARSDIFSFGLVLYEMLTGKRAFAGENAMDVISSILHKEPVPLRLLMPELSPELERIVGKALRKDFEERYQTARDLLVDLKDARQELDFQNKLERTAAPPREQAETQIINAVATDAVQTTSSTHDLVAKIKNHKLAAGAALLVLTVGIAALYYFAYGNISNRQTSGEAIDSVAVLPFTNTANDPDMEILSDGISESLRNSLSELPGMKVIASNSSSKYKGKEIDPQEVANALRVQAMVTGKIVRLGDTLQISVELVNARNKTQMWGAHYNRKAADLQAVQGEIARTIGEKLRVKLTGAQEQQVTKHVTENPEAYQLFLNGEFFRRRGGIGSERKAFDYYNRAIALDPNFAQAYVRLAEEYQFSANGSLSDPKDALPRAKEAVQKALVLDDTLAQAHAGLGRIKVNEWDWEGAEIEFKRALELNPNLERVHSQYSYYLSDVGRHTEALAEIKRAEELDPLNLYTKADEGLALHNAHRFDEAIRQLQHVNELQPDFSFGRFALGTSYAMKGMYPEAIAAYQKFSNLEGEKTENQIFLGYSYAMSGQREKALAILKKMKTTTDYVSPAELAILYTGLGDKEGAFQELERAYAAHDLQMQYLKVEPHYDSLRSDPRFTDLMRRVGLPQ